MVKKMIKKNPAIANQEPYKAVLENEKAYFEKGGTDASLKLMAAAYNNVTEDEFEASVKNFFATTTYPKYNVPCRQITYQPQIEVMNFLRANGFKIFICTEGTIEFIRSISESFYGIPKDQVIGTSFEYEFIDSSNVVFRKPVVRSFNDKLSKPANIQLHIGTRPVFTCGNAGDGGDIAMLKYSQSDSYPNFQMIINHDDSLREFYYQEKDNATLNEALKNNWHIASMKNDWKTVFVKQ